MKSTEHCIDEKNEFFSKKLRGRPPRLSRTSILEAGLAMIQDNGIENLTMRTLAQSLDVAPMSLYSHVKDKDDLMVGIAQMVFEQFKFDMDSTHSWDQQIRKWMHDIRIQLHKFPQLPQLYTYNERYSASLLNTTAVGINILKKADIGDNSHLVMTTRALMWFVLGYATLESFVKLRTSQASLDQILEQLNNLPLEQQAILQPLKPFLENRNIDQIFEFGTTLMINGIKYQQRSSSAPS